MKKFLTTALVGAFLGAFEGGALYSVLLVIESRDGFVIGGLSDWLIPIFIMGLICGGIVGAIIGVLVALLNAGRWVGLIVGIVVGLVATEIVFLSYTPLTAITGLLAIATVLGGASIGLVTALLTFRGKDSYRTSETS